MYIYRQIIILYFIIIYYLFIYILYNISFEQFNLIIQFLSISPQWYCVVLSIRNFFHFWKFPEKSLLGEFYFRFSPWGCAALFLVRGVDAALKGPTTPLIYGTTLFLVRGVDVAREHHYCYFHVNLI